MNKAALEHKSADIERLFSEAFYRQYQTRLCGGASEPLYTAAETKTNPTRESKIFYRLDYFASALHEVSHWCIAGKQRRTLDDFGYWYLPDDRNANQQEDFQRVEKKPQALEMLFSIAANYPFQVSLDNLSQSENDLPAFRDAVTQQATEYCSKGLPERAAVFFQTLADYYNGPSLALATDAISKQTNPNKILAT
jgi:elongation factor P hydroxylase